MWFTSPCDSLVHPVDALVEEAGELVSEGHTVTVVQATLRTEQALARAGAGAGAYYHYITLHSLLREGTRGKKRLSWRHCP